MTVAVEPICVEEDPEMLRGQAAAFRLLADLFAEPPDDAKVDRTRHFLQFLGLDAGNDSGEDIRADFLRLFLGLRRTLAPPWESVYLSRDRQVFQEPAIAVRCAYLEAGVAHDGIMDRPSDHISLELEFVAALLERTAEAASTGAAESAVSAGRLRRAFVEAHLLRWVPLFARDICEHATTRFWKMASEALSALVDAACGMPDGGMESARL